MKKVLEDGTLGISENDKFILPGGLDVDLECDGSDQDVAKQEKEEEEDFFS